MIATVLPKPTDCVSLFARLPATQTVVLAGARKEERSRLAKYFGDTYRLLVTRTEGQLFNTLQHEQIQLIIIYADTGKFKTGLELCTCLKSTPLFSHLPVIVVLPTSGTQLRIRCLECGADAWLDASFSREYLHAQIRNVLGNRLRLKAFLNRTTGTQWNLKTGRPGNEAFLERINWVISEHLTEPVFDVYMLAQLLNMSRPTLYRKISVVTKLTPNQLIHAQRISRAAELLSGGETKVADIAKRVGFNSRSSFGKAFFKRFGTTPKKFANASR
jgi:AraC-like DNA-binding protein